MRIGCCWARPNDDDAIRVKKYERTGKQGNGVGVAIAVDLKEGAFTALYKRCAVELQNSADLDVWVVCHRSSIHPRAPLPARRHQGRPHRERNRLQQYFPFGRVHEFSW